MQTKSSDSFLVTVVNGVPQFHDVTDSALASGFHSVPMPVTEHTAPQMEEDSKSKTVTETFGVPLGKDGPKLEPVAAIPSTPDFPAVGTRLRFTKDGYNFCNTAKKGDEITVLRHTGYGIVTSVVGLPDGEEWVFGKLWRDGLEIVPPLPTPPVRPEGVPYEGDDFIYSHKDTAIPHWKDQYRWKDFLFLNSSLERWHHDAGPHGCKDCHYALRRGSAIHRAQPWFHESQVVAGEQDSEELPCAECGELISQSGDGHNSRCFQINHPHPEYESPAPKNSTYPPDESEWPEKPDAGEGMMWERVSDAGVFEDGDIIYDACNRVWDRGEAGQRYERSIVFTRVPAPQWRELGAEDKDEVITADHQVAYRESDDNWMRPAYTKGMTFGKRLENHPNFRARTKLPRPLPPSDVVDPVSGVNERKEWEALTYANGVIQLTGDNREFPISGKIVRVTLVDESAPAERKASGVEARVCEDIAARQAVGIKKYGTTVEGSQLPYREWLNHHYQELLDASVYVKKQMEVLDGKEGA